MKKLGLIVCLALMECIAWAGPGDYPVQPSSAFYALFGNYNLNHRAGVLEALHAINHLPAFDMVGYTHDQKKKIIKVTNCYRYLKWRRAGFMPMTKNATLMDDYHIQCNVLNLFAHAKTTLATYLLNFRVAQDWKNLPANLNACEGAQCQVKNTRASETLKQAFPLAYAIKKGPYTAEVRFPYGLKYQHYYYEDLIVLGWGGFDPATQSQDMLLLQKIGKDSQPATQTHLYVIEKCCRFAPMEAKKI